MKNKPTIRIKAKWFFIAMMFSAICWAALVAFIARKIHNADNLIAVITIIVLLFFISGYLLAREMNNSAELKDDDDQAN
jgi:membrane protein DedA with SNARE-associated domain